jgi:hypothetical protein
MVKWTSSFGPRGVAAKVEPASFSAYGLCVTQVDRPVVSSVTITSQSSMETRTWSMLIAIPQSPRP